MPRYPAPSSIGYSFGPGPLTPAVKWIIIANVVAFLATMAAPSLIEVFGLVPQAVIEHTRVWQLATYMFLHAGVGHILFNMLGVWMFGVELERMWGTAFFARYYAITGIGGGLTLLLLSLLPLEATRPAYYSVTIGASGALFGLLLAFAVYWPHRPILVMLVFPLPARVFVLIFGGLAFLYSFQPGRGIADAAHLGGLITGYLYLQHKRGGLVAEFKYRYLKWKMNRLRKKFDVYSGGRRDWDGKAH